LKPLPYYCESKEIHLIGTISKRLFEYFLALNRRIGINICYKGTIIL